MIVIAMTACQWQPVNDRSQASTEPISPRSPRTISCRTQWPSALISRGQSGASCKATHTYQHWEHSGKQRSNRDSQQARVANAISSGCLQVHVATENRFPAWLIAAFTLAVGYTGTTHTIEFQTRPETRSSLPENLYWKAPPTGVVGEPLSRSQSV